MNEAFIVDGWKFSPAKLVLDEETLYMQWETTSALARAGEHSIQLTNQHTGKYRNHIGQIRYVVWNCSTREKVLVFGLGNAKAEKLNRWFDLQVILAPLLALVALNLWTSDRTWALLLVPAFLLAGFLRGKRRNRFVDAKTVEGLHSDIIQFNQACLHKKQTNDTDVDARPIGRAKRLAESIAYSKEKREKRPQVSSFEASIILGVTGFLVFLLALFIWAILVVIGRATLLESDVISDGVMSGIAAALIPTSICISVVFAWRYLKRKRGS